MTLPSDSKSGPTTWKMAAGKYLPWLLRLAVWLSLLDLPERSVNVDLDGSWQAALYYFARHHFQAGRDYIFTYGPLGFLQTEHYDSTLFPVKIAYEIIFRAFIVLQMERVLSAFRVRKAVRFLYLAGFCVIANVLTRQDILKTDVCSFFLLFLLVLDTAAGEKPPIWHSVATGALLAILVLGKGNLTPFAAAVAIFASIRQIRQGRPFWLSCAVLFAAFYLLFWLLSGQQISGMPAYWRGTWEIGSGYNENMAVVIPTDYHWMEPFALIAIPLSLPAVYAVLRARPAPNAEPRASRGWAAGGTFLAAIILLAEFKTSFTRADLHISIFLSAGIFQTAMLAALLTWRRERRYVAIFSILAVLELLFLFAVRPFANPVRDLLRPPSIRTFRNIAGIWLYKNDLDLSDAVFHRKFLMPHIDRVVGNETVDVWPNAQALVIANGLNYRPRPVFQAYSAYNDYTSGANARLYDGPDAPKYILFWMIPIDEHFAFSEDGLALRAILQHYVPVEMGLDKAGLESLFIVMRHTDDPAPPSKSLWIAGAPGVPFGQAIQIPERKDPHDWMLLHIHLHKTASGQILSLLHGSRPVYLLLADANRNRFTGRLIPGTTDQGLLIAPLLTETPVFTSLYSSPDAAAAALSARQLVLFNLPGEATYDDKADIEFEEITPSLAVPPPAAQSGANLRSAR